MTFKTTLMAGTVLGVVALAAGSAAAQTPGASSAQLDALNRQIQALQSQVKTLSEKLEKEIKAVDKKVVDAPRVSIDNGRPRIRSASGASQAFDVAIRTRFHLDYGYWFPDAASGDLPDGFNVRRAFIGLYGTVFTDWNFGINADFSGRGNAGRLQDLYMGYTGFKGWVIEAGAFQPSFTLMDTISSNDIPFIERSATNNMAVSIVANEARTAVGFRHNGTRYRVSAYLTGQQIAQGANPSTTSGGINDDQASAIARVSFLAATGSNYDIHLGANYGYMWEPATNTGNNAARNYALSERPEIRIGSAPSFINTGSIDTDDYSVYGVEFGATYQAFWTMAEYFEHEFDQRPAGLPDVNFDSWYVAAGYMLTGERRAYSVASGNFAAPRVSWPFRTSGGYGTGAWELAVRYSEANLTDAGVPLNAAGRNQGDQSVWTLGVNWYVNPAIRFMLNYNIIEVDRPRSATGALIGTDRELESLAMRMQFQF